MAVLPLSAYAVKPALPVSAWSVSQISPDDASTGVDSKYCAAKVRFGNGDSLVIARDLAGALSAAYKKNTAFAAPGESYSLNLHVDDSDFRRFDATAVDAQTVLFSIAHDYAFFDALMAGDVLSIGIEEESYSLSLVGSEKGLRAVNDCLKQANNGRPLKLGSAPLSPPLLPLPVLAGYVPPQPVVQPQRRSFFNDPSQTYIKVRFPGFEAETEFSNVAPRLEYRSKICRQHNSEKKEYALLREVLRGEFSGKLELVSAAPVMPEDKEKTTPLTWARNGVKGSFVLVSRPAKVTSEKILEGLKQACSGDFAADKAGERFVKGISLQDYNIACITGEQSQMGSIAFLSDGFETAIFSFEAEAENFNAVLSEKKLLLEPL